MEANQLLADIYVACREKWVMSSESVTILLAKGRENPWY